MGSNLLAGAIFFGQAAGRAGPWARTTMCSPLRPVGGTVSPRHRGWDPKMGPHRRVLDVGPLVGPRRHFL